MRGVRNTELLRFLIHQFHESFVGPGDIDSQSQGGIRSGGEDGTIQQLPDCDGLAQLIAYHAAIVDKAVVRDIDGDGNGIIQAFQVFSSHQNRHDFCHGGGADDSFGIFLRQNGAVSPVNDYGVGAGKSVVQTGGIRRFRRSPEGGRL